MPSVCPRPHWAVSLAQSQQSGLMAARAPPPSQTAITQVKVRAAETCCLFCKLFAGHVTLNNHRTRTQGQPRLPPVVMFFEGPVTESRLPAHSPRARPGSSSGPLGASLLGPATHKTGLAMAKVLLSAGTTGASWPGGRRAPTERPGPARRPCRPANNPPPSAPQQRYIPTIRDHRPPPAAPHAAPAPFVAAEPESCQTRPRP